jgi:hypothetical protein
MQTTILDVNGIQDNIDALANGIILELKDINCQVRDMSFDDITDVLEELDSRYDDLRNEIIKLQLTSLSNELKINLYTELKGDDLNV